jgi:hypothetical protein
MMFSDHVEWIRMTSGGARKIAALLNEKADASGPAKEKKKSVKPRKRVVVKPGG